ncbi:MAG: glutamate formimidoyltransferase [Candidatus Cloacimonetes bacterium 4572_65]|nr:MAG: glutamate formimidoyltransferase [Candidatus Cloacimonetes bacterium 4572_65]
MKLIECVPNFSEGRETKVLDAISASVNSVKGVTLLDVDPGAETNRTVFTFVGTPEVVLEAAFQAIKKASELIDMSKHHGTHARMGATDVCPFIPISEVSVEECVEYSKTLAKRVGEELNIPIYLYEHSASKPEWSNLAEVRKGEYEALPAKMEDPNWKPDFGPHEFNAKSGATVVGVREFLIAYNINLNTRDKAKAHDIALDIRERGRFARDENNKFVRDENGKKVKKPGIFKECKAVGWFIDEYDRAQISINLTNFRITPVHEVLEKVRELALAKGIHVTGSELVGLTPKAALIDAGKFYLKRMGECAGIPERKIMETAVKSMGLDDLAEFDLDKKVIEYAIMPEDNLSNMTILDFIDELSSDSPAPGGGSVAAVCSAMSGALSAMVSNLTVDKKGYDGVQTEARKYAEEGQRIKELSIAAIDEDTQAFYIMMDAMRLPKKSDADKASRVIAMEEATKNAILVPLKTLEICWESVQLAEKVATIGNVNALSDAGVAAITANAGAKSAYLNVIINMGSISDKTFITNITQQADTLCENIDRLAISVEEDVLARL